MKSHVTFSSLEHKVSMPAFVSIELNGTVWSAELSGCDYCVIVRSVHRNHRCATESMKEWRDRHMFSR